MTEKELQELVLATARQLGYLAYHTHDSRRSAPGFPDLVLARAPNYGRGRPKAGRIVFAELKDATGELSEEQAEWAQTLTAIRAETPDVDFFIWRPRDWTDGTIIEELKW